MSEIRLNGLCYRFNDSFNLFDFLDMNADGVYAEGHEPIAVINTSGAEEVHYMGQVFQFSDGWTLMALLDENASEMCEE